MIDCLADCPPLSAELEAWLGTLVRLRDIADMCDVKPGTAKVWRGRQLAGDRAACLPSPVSVPDALARLFGGPVWLREDIERWARQTGRMTVDGQPRRLPPPGRPRGHG